MIGGGDVHPLGQQLVEAARDPGELIAAIAQRLEERVAREASMGRGQPGDRLAGRTRKVQDVFTDAKVPRRERATWPLVVRGEEVVAIPGIVENPDVEVTRP